MDIISDLGPTAIARMFGVRPPSVVEWRTRGIPAERCPTLERETQGRYCCEAMRPDVHWLRVPDAEWPWHSEGRPLIDVVAAERARKAA